MAAFPSLCAPQKVKAGSAAVWRPPRSGDQEADGRPGYPQRTGRPSERVSVRGLEEGAGYRRCGTAPLRGLLRAVAAE